MMLHLCSAQSGPGAGHGWYSNAGARADSRTHVLALACARQRNSNGREQPQGAHTGRRRLGLLGDGRWHRALLGLCGPLALARRHTFSFEQLGCACLWFKVFASLCVSL
jgi:hypothetical protein